MDCDQAGFAVWPSPLITPPAAKYLQAAREVGNHMVPQPDGIDFAPYPMLVETDREKYAIQRIVNFIMSSPPIMADHSKPHGASHESSLGKPHATLASIAAEAKVNPPASASHRDSRGKDAAGPVAKLQGMWRAIPGPMPHTWNRRTKSLSRCRIS